MLDLKQASLLSLIALSAFTAQQLQAETIKIPVGQQSSQYQQLQRPTLGMHTTHVEKLWGEPLSLHKPKGSPPISRWEYEQFIVYFESSHVIHTVLKHQRRDQTETTTEGS